MNLDSQAVCLVKKKANNGNGLKIMEEKLPEGKKKCFFRATRFC